MNLHLYRALLLCALLPVLPLAAQDYSPPEALLETGHYNDDGLPDTLYGAWSASEGYVASRIAWGAAPEQAAAITLIAWPAWQGMRRSAASRDFDGDGMADLLFFLRGIENGRDTAAALTLWGRSGMEQQPVIDLRNLSGLTHTVLEYNTHIHSAAHRDQSGALSYVTSISPPAEQPQEAQEAQEAAALHRSGRVYPNPGQGAGMLETPELPAGSYRIALYDMQGRKRGDYNAQLGAPGTLAAMLNFDLPTGYYVLKLHSASELIGVYPLVITK